MTPLAPSPRAGLRYRRLLKLMHVADHMHEAGWRVDFAHLGELRARAMERIERFRETFLTSTGLPSTALGVAGVGSTHAVRDHFWLTAGAPHVVFDKRTKRPQFTTEALVIYASDYGHKPFAPAAAALYGLRKNFKIVQFLLAYEQLGQRDGRVHFSFNPAGTQTGRWTSATRERLTYRGEPTTFRANAQQVPKRVPVFDFGKGPEALSDSCRGVFVADEGCVLLAADYDALELRLIAYVYGAKKIIRALERGEDTHMMNALGVFKELDLENASPAVRKSARNCAKTLAYAVSYQMHDPKSKGHYPSLFKAMKKEFPSIVEQQANVFAQRFFELHPEIKEGQARVRELVDERGFNELAIDGRRLYYPNTMRGYNQALNFPMQGTGGALMNKALLALYPTLQWESGEQVRAQVHDELVVQAPAARAAEVAERLTRCMALPATVGAVRASLPAVCLSGHSWGSLAPM